LWSPPENRVLRTIFPGRAIRSAFVSRRSFASPLDKIVPSFPLRRADTESADADHAEG